MEAVVAGTKVNLTEDGYLTDFSQWTKEIGTEIAKQEGIEMTDRHWEVINGSRNKLKQVTLYLLEESKKVEFLILQSFTLFFQEDR